MNPENFVNKVLRRLPDALFEAENCNLEELLMLKTDIARMYADGWLLDDAVAYIRCTEYASPNLDEDIALARMAKISAKYKNETV
jgi:hypothetical protein